MTIDELCSELVDVRREIISQYNRYEDEIPYLIGRIEALATRIDELEEKLNDSDK